MAGKRPELASIDAAIVHTAIFDAVNAVCGSPYTPYSSTPNVQPPALADAAAAAAAHDTLVGLYPEQQADLDRMLADFLNTIQGHEEGKRNGVAAGQQAAAAILQLRANDGRNAGTPWNPPPPGPMIWQPTPPAYLPPASPWVKDVTPWALASPSQYRVGPPPSPDSAVWVRDYNEVKAYGGATSSARSPEQTDLGLFVGGAGVHPMLQWHSAWRGIVMGRRLSTIEAARLFGMLATAASDGLIACWDSKYTYAFWRPVTAIREGGANPALDADPNWSSLAITPNHPEYPAAHGCLSGAVVEVLTTYFGTDQFDFTMSSAAPNLMQPVREYHSFSAALQDILDARIYGGMHYRNSTSIGAALGESVGWHVAHNLFLPRQ